MTDVVARQPALDASQARALTDRIKVGVEAVWDLITEAYIKRAWSSLGYQSWDDYCAHEFGTARLRLPREERTEVVASLRESGLSIRAIASATGISDQTVQRDLSSGVVNHYTSPKPEPIGVEVDEDALADDLIAEEQALPPLPENYMNVPGAPTDSTPGQTERVSEALAKAQPVTIPNPVTGVDGKTYHPTKPDTPRRRKPIGDSARDLGLDIAKITKRIEEFGTDDRLVRNKNEVAPRLRHHLEHAIKVCQDLNQQLST